MSGERGPDSWFSVLQLCSFSGTGHHVTLTRRPGLESRWTLINTDVWIKVRQWLQCCFVIFDKKPVTEVSTGTYCCCHRYLPPQVPSCTYDYQVVWGQDSRFAAACLSRSAAGGTGRQGHGSHVVAVVLKGGSRPTQWNLLHHNICSGWFQNSSDRIRLPLHNCLL